MQERGRIPRSRKKRIELIKCGAKDLEESLALKEIEGFVTNRITEKMITTLIAFIWLMIAMYGKTPYCQIWGIPFAIISLVIGLWMI
ncbi:hypothetical protein NH288_05600 [Anaerococcus sp. NML200537]|uniref:hypothetical protein n=1 Tax=Anaerococcus sp. NML200537 TaxID=2954485 RepID=UPI0022385CC6|nr:hypothetical protein [Anaerococcus sp. NML200537]MCW6701558.1 hypothetical protein [Anaerococcus sp. NML200537]